MGLSQIIDADHYGSLENLLRINSVYVTTFKAIRSRKAGEVVLRLVTADNIEEDLVIWAIYEQVVLITNVNFEN